MTYSNRLMLGSIAAAAIVLAAVALWYTFLRDDSPPPVSISGAVSSLNTATPTAAATTSSLTPTPATQTASASATEATGSTPTPLNEQVASSDQGIAGTWTIAPSGESFVGYRVGEELAGIGTTEAVGRTSSVDGSVVIDGTAVTSVSIEADLATLQSDESFRDQALRRQALETSTYPTATFELTEPIVLDGMRNAGETFTTNAIGNLTLHGVTKELQLPLQTQFTNGVLVVVGSTEIVFADFDIDQPSAQRVLSVEDRGQLELQLFFSKG